MPGASKVYKTANGWCYIIWSDSKAHPDRPQVSEALKTRSKTDAEKRRAELLTAYYEGEHDPWVRKWFERRAPQKGELLSSLVEDYATHKLHQKGRRGWKESSTYKRAKNVLDNFALHCGPVANARYITEDRLYSFYHQPSLHSDWTRQDYHNIVGGFLNWLVKHGYLEENPQIEVNAPQKKLVTYLKAAILEKIFERHRTYVNEQIEKGFCQPDNPENLAYWYIDYWRLIARCGARPAEALNLRTDDIIGGDIHIGRSFQVKTGQRGAGERSVPIMDWARDVIDRYLDPDYRKEQKIDKSPFLFGRRGESTQKRLNKAFVRACRQEGVFNFTVKDLRKVFAIWYMMANRDKDPESIMLSLMRKMGHTTFKTTLIYLHSVPSDGEL